MAQTLVEFLKGSAEKFGDRTALLFKPGFRYRKWTYARLWEEAGRVASLLQQRGLRKGDRAVLWGHNCPQWVIVFFGCARAGVIAVPLDVRSAPDFVERVIARTRPSLAFVSRAAPAHDRLEIPRVDLEQLDGLIADLPAPAETAVDEHDLIEIMFTSGTTGDPKGVMITHANLMANLEAASQYIPGKPSYRLLSILPLSHMFEQMACLFVALRCGANITYPTSRQPTVLFRTMRERRVTTLLLVPQALDLFMKGIEREVKRQGREGLWNVMMKVARYTPFPLRRRLFWQVHRRFGGCLDFIVSGGAALDPALGAKWHLLGVRIVQGYGATECSPVITCHKLASPRLDSVGLPLPGVAVMVSGDGEVLVRGPNVTPGYWEAPEQTASALAGGWYRTGDLGSFDARGFLHLRGRKKDMIVLASGQNVFPEDIEAVLKQHPDVTDAVVVGLPKGPGVEVHAAIIAASPEAAREAVAWANAQLADHQHILGCTCWAHEDFPRTHTLKVKRGVVLDMLCGAVTSAPAAVPAPRESSTAPRGLKDLVAEIGGVPLDQVTPDKALGDLNVDSLGRVELLSAIEEGLGVYLDESLIGPDTTLKQLEGLLARESRSASAPNFPGWGMAWWCRVLRGGLQRAGVFPLLALTTRLEVKGREDLENLPGPVLFAANHNLLLDSGLILKALPSRVRRRLAIAAAADVMRRNIFTVLNPLMGNGFPFSREGNIRASLDNLGTILDRGWSVLICPEGKLTIGGPMQPFMAGLGLIAVEGKVPVVPVHVVIRRLGAPPSIPFWRRSDVEIRFGKPLSFPPGTPYLDATQAVESAVAAL